MPCSEDFICDLTKCQVVLTPLKRKDYPRSPIRRERSNVMQEEPEEGMDQSLRKKKRSCTKKFQPGYFKVEEYPMNKTTFEHDKDYTPTSANMSSDSDEEPVLEKYYNETSLSSSEQSSDSDEEPHSKKSHENRPLSEFEKRVQKNIAEKMALFEELGINEIKRGFATSSLLQQKQKKKPAPKKRSPTAPKVPTRRSFRLLKLDVDSQAYEKEVKQKIEEEKENNKLKVIPPSLRFREGLSKNDFQNYSVFFDGINFRSSSDKNDYTADLQRMRIKESHVAKVVPQRTTALAVHPMTELTIVAAGDKTGQIGLWNVNSQGPASVFKTHNAGITLLKFHPDQPHCLISSSYDGSMRCADFERQYFDEICNLSVCCTYFDIVSATTYIISHDDGSVSLLDNRESKKSQKSFQCHYSFVKTVSVHPVDKNFFASCDRKGVLCLWDLRNMKKDPLYEVSHHNRCCQSAYFSPVTGRSILTTSSDDTVCIFDSKDLSIPVTLTKSLKHNNQSGRWLSVFRAMWMPGSDSAFVIGSMNYPRQIDVFGEKMKRVHTFTDENLLTITSCNVFHPSRPVLAAANSSGKVHVFSV